MIPRSGQEERDSGRLLEILSADWRGPAQADRGAAVREDGAGVLGQRHARPRDHLVQGWQAAHQGGTVLLLDLTVLVF